MPDENFGIVVTIDGRSALATQSKVDRGFAANENAAREFEKAAREALREVERSARETAAAQAKAAQEAARAATAAAKESARAQAEASRAAARAAEQAAREAAATQAAATREWTQVARAAEREREEDARAATIAAERRARARAQAEVAASRAAASAARQAARDQEESARAITIAAERRAKAREDAERRQAAIAKKISDDRARAQGALASAYKSIVGPAAEYREKLNQILQLERQGAITAKQRAQAVAGMQREMKQFSAQQQGGVRGAVSSFASSQLGAVAAPAAAIAATAMAVKGALDLSDSYQTLTNRIRAVTESEFEAIRVRGELLRISNETRVSTSSTAEVYGRMAAAGQALGKSQREVLTFTESLSKAVKVSGATATEAQAGMIQLAQGLGAGALRGDELRSVLEQLPYVADVIARSLGVTRGQLRSLGEQGKITSEAVFKAFADMRGEIDGRFSKSVATVSDLMTVARNVMTDVVGSLVEATGVVPMLADAFEVAGKAAQKIASDIKSLIGIVKEFDDVTGGLISKLGKVSLGGTGRMLGFAYETSIFGMAGNVATRDLEDTFKEYEALREKLRKAAEADAAQERADVQARQFLATDSGARDRAIEAFAKMRDGALDAAFGVKTLEEIEEEERKTAEKAARAHREALQAQRELAAEWKAWTGDVGEGVAGVMDRLGDRVRATIDPMREFGEQVAENHAKLVEFNEGVSNLAGRAFDKLRGLGEGIGGAAAKSVDAMVESIEAATPRISLFAETIADQLGGAIKSSIDLLVDWAKGADVSVKDFARSIAESMAKAMASLLAFQALKALVGGAGNGGAGTFAGALAGALGFGNFAAGGSFVVPSSGGGGGIDSTPVMFRATPGERVTITPPGASNANARAAAPVVNVNPTIVFDPREALAQALRSPGGHQMVIDVIASNPTAIRAALSR